MRKFREKASSESGFTLVELLVVMLILALLAAIAIPAFFNQRDKAKDSDAKADVRTAATALETFATDNNGSYAGATAQDLADIEGALQDAVDAGELAVVSTADTYLLTATSTNDTNGADAQTFSISRAVNGTTDRTCTVDGEDGCPTGGQWSE